MSVQAAYKPMTRREMAARLADDIPEGWYVNLGIGAPLQVADYVPVEREAVFQSENGVLGAFQVAENGDLANWSTSDNESAPAVGGAMDLASGTRNLWVIMDHTTKTGESRLVRRCTYPLTAVGCAKRIYTNLAVIDVTVEGFVVRDMVKGLTLKELQDVTDAPLHVAKQ